MQGIIEDMPMKTYHAEESVSAHNLMDMDDSCEIADSDKKLHRARLLNNEEEKEAKALLEGTGIHFSVQAETLDKIYEEYAVAPKARKNSTEYKTWLTEVCGNRIPVSQAQMDMFIGCREATRKHSVATVMIENGKMERSGFCEIMGVKVKARPDIDCMHVPASERYPCLVDIKSRQKKCAIRSKWLKDFYFYKTYLQAGLQILVWRHLGFDVQDYHYLLVEKEYPYKVNVIPLGVSWMHQSIIEVHEVISKWKDWQKTGSEECYALNQLPMEMPEWMERQLNFSSAKVAIP